MSNEYKEWLKEQTFESLANDNLRIKLELKTAKEENEKLTQQNKQMKDALEKIVGTETKNCDICIATEFCKNNEASECAVDIAKQALNEVNNEKNYI